MKTLEKYFAFFALVYFAGGLNAGDAAQNDMSAGAKLALVWMVFQAVLYALLALFIVIHRKRVLESVRPAAWIVVLCGFVFLSATWSSHPLFTFRRSVILMAATAFAFYLGSCFEWDEQLDMFGRMVVVCVVGSYLMVLAVPSYGISHDIHWGAWKGMFGHKNALGAVMAFGILALLIAKPRGVPPWMRYAGAFLAIPLVVLSQSALALATAAFCIVVYFALFVIRVKDRRTLPLWVAFVPLFTGIAWFMIGNADSFRQMLGRDQTLTGRLPLWNLLFQVIQHKPWLGYGYSVFWNRPSLELSYVVGQVLWVPLHAHNGYLDICLDLGLIGLGIFAIGLFIAFWRAAKLFRRSSGPWDRWPLVFLVFFAVSNLAESYILRTRIFYWVPYVSIFVYMGLLQTQEKHRLSAAVSLSAEGEVFGGTPSDGPSAGLAPNYGD
jgi:O-antigen ligase